MNWTGLNVLINSKPYGESIISLVSSSESDAIVVSEHLKAFIELPPSVISLLTSFFEAEALWPIIILLLPVINAVPPTPDVPSPALSPIITLLLPLVKTKAASVPNIVFLEPVVTLPAKTPIATFFIPVSFVDNDFVPIPIFLSPVVFINNEL